MGNMKHTPRACVAYETPTGVMVIHEDGSQDGRALGSTVERNHRQGPTDEDHANARLWAAAPEMLEALEWAATEVSCFPGLGARNIDRERCTCSGCEIRRRARAAIAKATGEGGAS